MKIQPIRSLSALPRWAQEHIENLQRQRDSAVKTLNAFKDQETPSKIWFEEHPCIGEAAGPSSKRHYLQTHEVTFLLSKEEVTVGFQLNAPALRISTGWKACTFKASASNVIELWEEKR